MIVSITRDDEVRLLEPSDFKRFHVSAAEGADVDQALRSRQAGWRAAEDGDARISTAWLDKALAAALPDQPWSAEYGAMLAYAASKGWLHDDGTVVAHVERLA
jgi:hypothetical protein